MEHIRLKETFESVYHTLKVRELLYFVLSASVTLSCSGFVTSVSASKLLNNLKGGKWAGCTDNLKKMHIFGANGAPVSHICCARIHRLLAMFQFTLRQLACSGHLNMTTAHRV